MCRSFTFSEDHYYFEVLLLVVAKEEVYYLRLVTRGAIFFLTIDFLPSHEIFRMTIFKFPSRLLLLLVLQILYLIWIFDLILQPFFFLLQVCLSYDFTKISAKTQNGIHLVILKMSWQPWLLDLQRSESVKSFCQGVYVVLSSCWH